MGRTELLEHLTACILRLHRPHPIRVGIDGHSAAGKTSMANYLAALIAAAGRPVIRASIDDFHRPAAERYVRGRLSPVGFYEDTFDFASVRRVLLEPLGPGGNRRYRTAILASFHERPIDDPEREAPANAIAIVDGVFLYRPELNDFWELRIYLHIEPDEVLRRGPKRDAVWMGSLATAVERYTERYLPGEQLYLDAVRPHEVADIVIDNTNFGAPVVIRTAGTFG